MVKKKNDKKWLILVGVAVFLLFFSNQGAKQALYPYSFFISSVNGFVGGGSINTMASNGNNWVAEVPQQNGDTPEPNYQDRLFVDKNSANCNNDYDRATVFNPDTPWCSLKTENVGRAQSGDTIFIAAGIYEYDGGELQFFDKHYSPSLKIQAYPGEEVVFGNWWVAYTQPQNGLWTKEGDIWVTSPEWIVGSRDHVALAYTTSEMLFTYNSDDWNTFIDSSKPEGIIKSDGKIKARFKDSGFNPNNAKMYLTTSPYRMIGIEQSSGIHIKGITIKNSNVGVHMQGSDNVVLEDMTFINGIRNGVFTEDTDNVVVRNCFFKYYFNPSEWYWKLVKGSRMEGSAMDLKRMSHHLIENNRIDGWFNGIFVEENSGSTDIKIMNNVMYNMYDDAIEIEPRCNGIEVKGNKIYDAFHALSLSPAVSDNNDCVIHYNILDGSMEIFAYEGRNWEGGAIKMIGNDAKLKGIKIDHNTIVGKATDADSNQQGLQENVQWTNNIFSTDGVIFSNMGLASDGVVYNNNVYHSTTTSNMFIGYNNYNGDHYGSLSAAKNSQHGTPNWDSTSREIDPQLNGLYRPQNSEVCQMNVGAVDC